MVTQSNNLNLTPGQISPRVNVSQYDKKSRTLTFSLFNGSQPFNIASGMAVTIEGTKPDNTGFQYAMTSTIGSNVVSMSIEQQMTVLAGEVPCEIVVSSTGKRLASANFILVVEPAALNEDTIISETELPLIEEAAELAENIAIYVATIEADAAKAEGYAVGKQNGQDVPSTSPYYHNNAKYYKEQAATSASTASTKASNAATSASNASTSASNAATSATNAANSASTASTAASTATTKASDASNAAQTATTKASEASASAQAAQQAAASLTVDSATSTTSTNPVQNKVITGAVTSLKETFTNNGAHNLNGTKYWLSPQIESNGVTFIYNSDGTITANGTNDNSADSRYCGESLYAFTAPFDAQVILRCETIGINIGKVNAYVWDIEANERPYSDSTKTSRITGDAHGNVEVSFWMEKGKGYRVTCRVQKNASSAITVNNVVFKPMLRLASDTDTTYTPYAKTNQQLTRETTGLIDNVNQNGAKNLIITSLDILKAANTSGTWDGNAYTRYGITCTVNDDLSITVNGTATANLQFILNRCNNANGQPLKDGQNYILTGCPSGGSQNSYRLAAYQSGSSVDTSDRGEGKVITGDSTTTAVRFIVFVTSGATVNNLTFYPMLRLASDPDDTYVPYAMTNREITNLFNEFANPQELTLTPYDDRVTDYSLNDPSTARIVGNTVFISIRCKVLTALTDSLTGIFTISSEGKPTSRRYGTAVVARGTTTMAFPTSISTSGTVVVFHNGLEINDVITLSLIYTKD